MCLRSLSFIYFIGIYRNDKETDRYNVRLDNVEFIHKPNLPLTAGADHELSFGFKSLTTGPSGSLVRVGDDFALELNNNQVELFIDDSFVDSVELIHESVFHLVVIRNDQHGRTLVEVSRDSLETVNGENDLPT